MAKATANEGDQRAAMCKPGAAEKGKMKVHEFRTMHVLGEPKRDGEAEGEMLEALFVTDRDSG